MAGYITQPTQLLLTLHDCFSSLLLFCSGVYFAWISFECRPGFKSSKRTATRPTGPWCCVQNVWHFGWMKINAQMQTQKRSEEIGWVSSWGTIAPNSETLRARMDFEKRDQKGEVPRLEVTSTTSGSDSAQIRSVLNWRVTRLLACWWRDWLI